MEEGTFVAWLKGDGETIRIGDALYELEGEKASQEIESVDAGILRIPPNGPKPGETVKVGAAIGFLVADGEPTPELTPSAATTATAESVETPSMPAASETPIAKSNGSSKIEPAASPRARRVARELGVDWKSLVGTGAGGRVREEDVRAAAKAQVKPAAKSQAATRVPISSKRRVIADRLSASRAQTVPVTLQITADATNLVNLREQFKSVGQADATPSYQDILTKLVAAVLLKHPLLAGRWEHNEIALPGDDGVHIGIAVDTEQGLLVPVLADVPHLPLTELAKRSRSLIEKARAGRLAAVDMQGGVFTITNLGSFGIEHFSPVINLPETAILGVGAIRREAVALDDGRIEARWQIHLSLTFDHRVIDGAPAAKFLQDLTSAIANPSAWLLA